ncbi:MAG: DUF4139 domain-containing protein [Myxococcales bacterium]|nr:DUF4139 domain-containing protein [Myxococcales bacterium]
MTSPLPGRVLVMASGAALALAIGGQAVAGGRDRTTVINIKRAADPSFGGESYGGGGGAASGYVTQERQVEIGADGTLRFPGVAATLDAATVEFRSTTDPSGTRVVEQRLINDLVNPEALLLRQVGKPITITLASGELTGTLRALAPDALVIDTGDRAAHIVPRGPQILAIKLAAAAIDQEPTLEWRLTAARAGRHDVVVSYRADALGWQPDYSAVLADDGTLDLTAWATITNDTGADFADVDLTLTAGGGDGLFASLGLAPGRPSSTKPRAWKIPGKVALRSGQAVQVELAPKKTGIKPRKALVFEALAEGAGADNASPTSDCGAYVPLNPRTGEYLEIDVGVPLPSGRVRLLRRSGHELTVIGTDELRASATTGVVRVSVGGGDVGTISGERTQVQCQPDGSGRSMREDIEVTVTNDGASAADVVVREYMYRWHHWKILRESVKGTRADDRAQEYRLKVPAGASRSVTFTVQYEW